MYFVSITNRFQYSSLWFRSHLIQNSQRFLNSVSDETWITKNYTHIFIKSLRFDWTFVSCFADISTFPAVIISAFGELKSACSIGHRSLSILPIFSESNKSAVFSLHNVLISPLLICYFEPWIFVESCAKNGEMKQGFAHLSQTSAIGLLPSAVQDWVPWFDAQIPCVENYWCLRSPEQYLQSFASAS